MKLLLAADIFPPEVGGPATYVVALANSFLKDEVCIVSLNPSSDESLVNCPLYRVTSPSKLRRYVEYFWLLWKQSKNAEVVYAMGPVNAGLPALVVSLLRRKKFFVKVVGDYAWEQGTQRYGVKESIDAFQNKKYGFGVEILRVVQRLVTRHAHGVIVPSHYLQKIVMGWGLPENKIHTVYNSVDFVNAPLATKSPQEQRIVSVGRLVPWKGFAALIDVFDELKNEFPSLQLKIIGDGPEHEFLNEKIKEKNLEEKVEMLGNLSHEKTLSFIQSADMFVLNSGYEGMSHVILEAMFLDRPVLASNVGGNPEVVKEYPHGDLFEYNNKEELKQKIKHMLVTHRPNSAEYSQTKKEFLEQFRFEHMIQKTKNILGQ